MRLRWTTGTAGPSTSSFGMTVLRVELRGERDGEIGELSYESSGTEIASHHSG
jgi:hypothetical protein